MELILVVFQNIKLVEIKCLLTHLFFLSSIMSWFSVKQYMLLYLFFRLIGIKIPKGITIKRVVEPQEEAHSTDQEEEMDHHVERKTTTNPKTIQKARQHKGAFVKVKSTTFMCLMCHSIFANILELNEHMDMDIPCTTTTITCPICEKQFATKSGCAAHVRAHDSVRYDPKKGGGGGGA